MENLLFLNLGGVQIFILSLIGLIPFILIVYCLYDISRSKFKDPLNKLLWTIIVIFVPILGSVFYLILGRSQKKSFESVTD
jgi:hypothetical protein